MRRIEKFYKSKKEVLKTKFELEYLKIVNTHFKLTDLSNTYFNKTLGRNLKANEELFIKDFIRDFEDIIKGKPDRLLEIKNDYLSKHKNVFISKNNKRTKFNTHFSNLLNYTGFRSHKDKGVFLAKSINIKACIYCNCQYTITVDSLNKAFFQLDHFFCQKEHPYFSLSLYNLIPCCASCNQAKKERDFDLINYYHPYKENLHLLFEFDFDKSFYKKYLKGNISENDINIELNLLGVADNAVENHNNVFRFKEKHQLLTNEAYIIAVNSLVYDKAMLKSFIKRGSKKHKLFDSEDEAKKFIFGTFTTHEEINQAPLTKFKQDLMSKLKVNKS